MGGTPAGWGSDERERYQVPTAYLPQGQVLQDQIWIRRVLNGLNAIGIAVRSAVG
jgi:hypothetical protein